MSKLNSSKILLSFTKKKYKHISDFLSKLAIITNHLSLIKEITQFKQEKEKYFIMKNKEVALDINSSKAKEKDILNSSSDYKSCLNIFSNNLDELNTELNISNIDFIFTEKQLSELLPNLNYKDFFPKQLLLFGIRKSEFTLESLNNCNDIKNPGKDSKGGKNNTTTVLYEISYSQFLFSYYLNNNNVTGKYDEVFFKKELLIQEIKHNELDKKENSVLQENRDKTLFEIKALFAFNSMIRTSKEELVLLT